MKLQYKSTEYEGNTEIQARSFGISDPKLIADMLSNMYPNPILALVREYLCNAIDAQRMIGLENTPVRVVAPSLLSGYFIVEDCGIGMSEEVVYELFATYGSSSKRDSNSLIGGFGIGSKAAFAYTNSFTVESIHDFVKRVFSVYVDDAKGPQIELLSSVRVPQKSGVTIKIPVKKTDINKFIIEINNVCKYLDVIPKVEGMEQPKRPEFVEHEDGDYYFIGETVSSYGSYGNENFNLLIKMGGIVYNYKYPRNKYQFTKNVILEYPIGTFQLAPSREEIIAKPEYQGVVAERLNLIEKNLNSRVQGEIKDSPTLLCAWKKFQNFNSILRNLKFKWKTYTTRHTRVHQKAYEYCAWHRGTTKIRQNNYVRIEHVYALFDAQGRKSNHTRKIKEWLNQNNLWDDFKNSNKEIVLLPENPKKQLRLWLRLGRPNVPIIRYDDVATKKSVKSRTYQPVKFQMWDSKLNYVKEADVDLKSKNSYQYILLYNNTIDINGNPIPLSSIEFIIKNCGITNDVILVPKTHWSKIPDHWKSLHNFINETYNSILTDCLEDKIKQKLSAALTGSLYSLKKYCLIESLFCQKYCKFLNNYDKYVDSILWHDYLVTIVDTVYVEKHERLFEIQTKIKNRILDKYPLLDYSYVSKSEEYVKAMRAWRKQIDKV